MHYTDHSVRQTALASQLTAALSSPLTAGQYAKLLRAIAPSLEIVICHTSSDSRYGPRMSSMSINLNLVLVILMVAICATAASVSTIRAADKVRRLQSIFGPVGTADDDTCPLASFQMRGNEVSSVCCATEGSCSTGLPTVCALDCAVVFMNYYTDCSSLMGTLQGPEVVAQLDSFNQQCLNRYDIPELLSLIRSMSMQGCSADETLDSAALALELAEDEGFGGADGTEEHFAVELGSCNYDAVQEKNSSIDDACCRASDADDDCEGGLPSMCDVECAIHYVPFYEDCNAVLHGSFGSSDMGGYNALYGACMQNSRRDISGLLRAM
eukprot:SAG11_NODE_4044_length_2089_cov_1.153769_1_plen_326_part_00